jgi:hypothetical protein
MDSFGEQETANREARTMSDQQGRAVSGSCLGGVAGLVLGVLIGGFLGSGSHSGLPKDGPIDPKPIDACVGFIGMALGAGIGGLIGVLGGSVLGAAIATRPQNDASVTVPDQHLEQERDLPPSAQESSETELSRLKARVAELEEKTRNNDQPARSENIQGSQAERSAPPDRLRD